MRTLSTCISAALAVASVSFFLTGCPGPNETIPPTGCKLGYVGDEDADIELEIVTLDPDYKSRPFSSGDGASILVPPQGGRVIFAGVRARNLDPCAVTLTGAVRDVGSMQTRVDARTMNLDVSADGWGQSDETDISSFSNVPVCSNNWASVDVFDQTFKLIIMLKDRDGKTANAELDVVPRCDEKKILTLDSGQQIDVQKECLCICKEGYITGEMCDTAP